MTSFTSASYAARLALVVSLVLHLASSIAHGQDATNVLEGFGSANVDTQSESSAGEGTVFGQVFDGASGTPLANVTVILKWPEQPGGGAKQLVQVTDADGSFRFEGVPQGTYTLSYVKSGYRASTMTGFAVTAGQVNRADFPIPPLPSESAAEVLELDAFVVEASTMNELLGNIELRMDSDALLNTMSAEELSKFAASDVADALKRVSGVNVVEGQFAIIRGLEDRYSSTMYNGAPVPSPDPNRQSPQLDLFPSEIVSNILVAKTFEADMPSNSAGGSIDIITHDAPGEWEIKVKGGTGFNDNAIDRFSSLERGSPIGKAESGKDVVNGEAGIVVAGIEEWFEREFRFRGLFNWEQDYDTAVGWTEKREPRLAQVRGSPPTPADLALGELNLSGGRFDLTTSAEERQLTGYGGFGFDVDEAGRHRIDTSVFYTKKRQQIVQDFENGYLPNFDYGPFVAAEQAGGSIRFGDFANFATQGTWIAPTFRESASEFPDRGPYWFHAFFEGKSFYRERDLLITQVNGEHEVSWLDGLTVSWATNYAQTSQQDQSFATQYFYEPCGFNSVVVCPSGVSRPPVPTSFPSTVDALGAGGMYATSSGNIFSSNDIEERQGFGRLDVDYETEITSWLATELQTSGWYEHARRTVDSSFLEGNFAGGSSQFAILANSPRELGRLIFGGSGLDVDPVTGEFQNLRSATNDSLREIGAWAFSAKGTFWEDFDAFGGVRVEKIRLTSQNDPYTGEASFDGSPKIYPSKYVFLDRLDNPTRNEVSTAPPAGTIFNDQIIGVDVPVDQSTTACTPPRSTVQRGCVDLPTRADIDAFINGEIDEVLVLPSAGLTYRALDGLVLRGAYSQTVARPSFREMGYYVSVEPGSDDLIIGNPQLQLSDVDSYDARVEYTWGDFGDLVAMSGFYKTVDDPIEAFIVRDPTNRDDDSSAIFRTFFNNPNQARLWGLEFELRTTLGFVGHDFLDYFSIGGNGTYIDAEVDRTEVEIQRAQEFFTTVPGVDAEYDGLARSRRLFGQPEWIANADLTFDQPDWGTRFTLAYFGISDVLIGAGTLLPGPDNRARGFNLDRYNDSFYQLDLIFTQRVWQNVTFGFRVKNLTDSTRRIIYDPEQTSSKIVEREFKVGRDYKFSVTVVF